MVDLGVEWVAEGEAVAAVEGGARRRWRRIDRIDIRCYEEEGGDEG